MYVDMWLSMFELQYFEPLNLNWYTDKDLSVRNQ